jgi:quinol monooxygenase YgiN
VVTEIAQFTAQLAKAAELERGLRDAMPIIGGAEGCRSIVLRRCVEDPNVFVYEIEWETIEHHTVRFRGGPRFAEYRGHIAGLFVDPVVVRHFETVE